MEQQSAIELQQVTFKRSAAPILDDVTINLPSGKTTVILGPSGCGKTTLLKVAAGLVIPDSGRVIYKGRNLHALGERENILFRRETGFVFQDSALWSNNSMYQNISLALTFHDPLMGEQEVRARVESLVKLVGYRESLSRRPAEASAGERKIVSFLRAIALHPSLVFMDEPLSEIDHPTAERMIEMIRDQKREGRTIVIVTHDPVLTSQLADNLVVLDNGRVLESGPFAQVVRSTNAEVISLLSRVLSEASTFDGNILDLLDEGTHL